MACNVIREIDFDEEIQVVVGCNIQGYSFNSFVRSYHAYMDVWNPLVIPWFVSKNTRMITTCMLLASIEKHMFWAMFLKILLNLFMSRRSVECQL